MGTQQLVSNVSQISDRSLRTTGLEEKISEKYGLLLNAEQLADLLGRTTCGLRFALTNSTDPTFLALRKCARRVGRRVYFPAPQVAQIIEGAGQ